MLSRDLGLRDAVLAPALLAGGILIGVLLELVIRRALRRRGTITTWGGDHVVLVGLRTAILTWFAVGGAAAAAAVLPLKPHFARLVNRALIALLVSSTTIAVARAVADSVKLFALRTSGAVRQSSIFVTLARLGVYALGLLLLLQALGVSITPLLTALGVGGLAVALALQDTLANLFAGLHIIASKKVRLGDFVRLEGGQEGYVIDISWRNTSIRQLTNSVIIVPNAKLASAIVTNYYQPERETAVQVELGAAYGSDLDRVEQVTIDVARSVLNNTPGGVKGFSPTVRFHALGDYSVEFTLTLRAREATDRYVLVHEFIKRLHNRYRREGIVVPYPVRSIVLEDESLRETILSLEREASRADRR